MEGEEEENCSVLEGTELSHDAVKSNGSHNDLLILVCTHRVFKSQFSN